MFQPSLITNIDTAGNLAFLSFYEKCIKSVESNLRDDNILHTIWIAYFESVIPINEKDLTNNWNNPQIFLKMKEKYNKDNKNFMLLHCTF